MKRDIPDCDSGLVLEVDSPDGVFHYDRHWLFDRVVFAYGFRLFFLLSAGYAVLGILVWAAFWHGIVVVPESLPANEWHAHEMVFGFAAAALCGFLLTAVPEWTKSQPRLGRSIALLAGVWLLGRLALVFGDIVPLWLVAVVNLSLLPILATWTIPPLWRDPARRHRSFIPLVPALWIAEALVFLDWMQAFDGFALGGEIAMRAINAGLHVYLIAIVLVLTRVTMVLVPLALDEQNDTESVFRPLPPRRNLAAATLILFAIADFIAPENRITGWIALAAAAAQFDRLADWHVGRVLLKPYMATVYIAYVWLAIGLAGLGLHALVDWDGFAAARHALGLGAAGTAILAVFMVAGLRHTGRDVVIPRLCIVAVLLVSVAAALRICVPHLFPEAYLTIGIGLSSLVWASAFGLYLVSFAPFLLAPRADGMPG